jgi:hypothetical protein
MGVGEESYDEGEKNHMDTGIGSGGGTFGYKSE